jgi:hypothetical protein
VDGPWMPRRTNKVCVFVCGFLCLLVGNLVPSSVVVRSYVGTL